MVDKIQAQQDSKTWKRRISMLSLLSHHWNKYTLSMSLPVTETTLLLTESSNLRCLWLLESCVRELVFARSPHGPSCSRSCFIVWWWVSSLISRSAYSEAQGCSMQGQQRYRHLLTGYLIFETVLIVYGIILESTGVTWRSVFVQGIVRVGYSPPYIYYELSLLLHTHMYTHTRTDVCTQTHTHTHTHALTHTHIHTLTYTHTNIHTLTHIYTQTHTH